MYLTKKINDYFPWLWLFLKKKNSMENCRVFFNTDHRESIFVNQPKMYSFF